MSASSKIIAVLVVALALLLAVLGVAYGPWAAHQQGIGEKRATMVYNLAIDQQKTAAGKLLDAETAKAATATKALNDFKVKQEQQDAKNQTTVTDLERSLHAAAGPAGRLRDPNAAVCGGGGDGAQGADPARAGDSPADAAKAGGLFSGPATALLQRLTLEADEINVAYASCRPDALALREVLR